jgi:hypothetical protein
MVARWEDETAILLRSKPRRVVRLRWTVGAMERSEWQLDQVVLDSDDAERRDFSRPRPDAGDPESRHYDLWLDPGFTEVAAVSEVLKPYDARLMRSYPVSTRINHAANDDPEMQRACYRRSTFAGAIFLMPLGASVRDATLRAGGASL